MYDYHIHTNFSDDSSTPMEEMIDFALKIGVAEIAVTDHFDPDYPDPDFPFVLDFEKYNKKLAEAAESYNGRIKVVKGIEIGIQSGGTLAKCESAANGYPYDFVLGSFHAALDQALDTQYFKNRDAAEGLYDFYTYMASCLAEYSNYDVVGHFNVVDRYVDPVPDYSPYMEVIESILKSLVEDGKGLEFNTSSRSYGMGARTMPSSDILKLYKSLGGEIITIGSDAHKAADVGRDYHQAVETLKSSGFRYVSTFENRKPGFVKI
ncbi:MAG: histidinol-phosphatase HisJ family protein [Clostridiales bacterium]|nr:histidinol-phosphatase HisJ family protein [Clostridiales bacterium]